MGASTKTSRFAVGFAIVGFLFVVIAFCSPYWLISDGVLKRPKFTNLGKSEYIRCRLSSQ